MSDAVVSAHSTPPNPRDCVTTGPPAGGIQVRPPDMEWRPAEAMARELVLLDVRHEAEGHACYRHLVERLNTLQAVQSSSQWQVDFDPATETVTVHWLRVLREGGVIDHLDPGRFRCLQLEENLERCVINGRASLLVLLEDIRPGDVLDSAITVRRRPRLMEEHFSCFTCVSYPMHVGQLFLSFRFREGRRMEWKSNIAALVPVVSTVEGMTEMRWERRGIKPLAGEENVPGWHLQGGWIQVSDFKDWREVSLGLFAAWHAGKSAAGLEEMLTRIRGSGVELREQVEMAVRFVQDDIRYLSMNVELGGQIPSAPGVVLKRRFGDCKDKARLLAELLVALGLRAHPLLVHTRMRGELEHWLPSPMFDHAVVCYEWEGVWRTVDATISMQGGGPGRRSVPRYGVGLPITSEGAAALMGVEVPAGSDGRMRLWERFEMDPSAGPSDLLVRLRVTGAEADSLRAAIHHHGVDGVARNREQFYRDRHPGLSRLGKMEWEDDREANAMTLAERYELPGEEGILPGQRQRSVDHSAHAITAFLPVPGELKRKRPFQLPYPIRVEHVMEVSSPSLPMHGHDTDSARCPEFTFGYKVTPVVGTVRISYELELHGREVPAEGMARYMEALRRVFGRRSIAIGVPRSRQRLHRRGDESLLDDHASTVEMVAGDIAHDEELRRSMGGGTGEAPVLKAMEPYREIDAISDPGLEAPGRRSRHAPEGRTGGGMEGESPIPARVIPYSGAISATGDEGSAPGGAGVPRGRSPARPRGRKRVSGNVKLGLGGCAVLLIGFPVLTWLGVRFMPGDSTPSAGAYMKSDDEALKDPVLEECRRLLTAGEAGRARARFAGLPDKYPLSLRVHTFAARLAVEEGQYDAAGRMLDKWELLYPTDPEVPEIRIDLLLAKGDAAGALSVAREFLKWPGVPPQALFQVARAHVAAGDPAQAEPRLLEYLKLEAGDVPARYLLGTIYQKSGRTAELVPLWRGALEQYPLNDFVVTGAGQQFLEAGLKQEAMEVLSAGAGRLTESAKVAFQYASLLKSQGNAEQAFVLFRRAMELDTAWVEPALNVALMLEGAGQADAVRAYHAAADRGPKEAASLAETGKRIARHSARGARVFFERALSVSPDSAEIWELLAKTHEALGDPARAAAARRKDLSLLKGDGAVR